MIQDTLNETKKIVWPEIEKHLKDPKYPAQFLIPAKFKKEVNLY